MYVCVGEGGGWQKFQSFMATMLWEEEDIDMTSASSTALKHPEICKIQGNGRTPPVTYHLCNMSLLLTEIKWAKQ